MTDNELHKFADELNEAAELCDDECGEWWSMLAAMWPRVRDAASSEFEAAYKQELRTEYQRFKDEFSIIEERATQTITYRRVRHYTEGTE